VITVLLVSVVLYFSALKNDIIIAIVFALITFLGISKKNNTTKKYAINTGLSFLSDLSMEIYLCHMFVFRTTEKIGLDHLTGSEMLNYCIISSVTIIGATLVSAIFRRVLHHFEMRLISHNT